MDYHIVPNVTGQTEKKSHHNTKDWHFEAQLFGAGMLILLLPLVSSMLPNKQPENVLGVQAQQVYTGVVYDSEYGYYYPTTETERETNVFSSIISSILSLLR